MQNTKEDRIEYLAADLWRLENPTQSVFACDATMKERYRARARKMNGPKPHWRDCLASEVTGACCQWPDCDC